VIAFVSIGLAMYEAYALTHGRATVTQLSTRWPTSALVWGWLWWLAVHFVSERRK
jgi:hypothetical protein